MAVESCSVTQTSQIWKHQWNSRTSTWSADNKDRCTRFLNRPAALTLKLIFILYSTPSFRTKACFLKASRSPVSNNKHRQINVRSKLQWQFTSAFFNFYLLYGLVPSIHSFMQSSHSHADQSSLTLLTCLATTLPVSCPGCCYYYYGLEFH